MTTSKQVVHQLDGTEACRLGRELTEKGRELNYVRETGGAEFAVDFGFVPEVYGSKLEIEKILVLLGIEQRQKSRDCCAESDLIRSE